MTDFYSDEAQKYLTDESIHWTAHEEGGSPLPYGEAAELAVDSYWPDDFVVIHGWRKRPYGDADFKQEAECALEAIVERITDDCGEAAECVIVGRENMEAMTLIAKSLMSQISPWDHVVELRVDAKRWVAEND